MASRTNASERDLKETISLLNAVIESTTDGILVVNNEGRIVNYNQNFVQLWRIPQEVMVSHDDAKALAFVLDQLLMPEVFIKKVKDLYERPGDESFDVLVFKDGRVYERHSKPQVLEGRFVGRVWSFRDVTKRESAIQGLQIHKENLEGEILIRTEQIRETQVFLDSIIENIPDMIFVKDADDLKFLRFNKAGEELLGVKREDLIGKSDYDFFSKESADAFTAKDREVISGRKVVDIPEEHIMSRVLGERILHTKKIPVCDRDGKPLYLLGISEDITEIKQAQKNRLSLIEEQLTRKALEEAVRLRDEFMSIASHELKTPLTALSMQIQLLRRAVERSIGAAAPPPERMLQRLGNCQQQVMRFTGLIDNLLDATRISAKGLSLNNEETDLCQIVKGVVDRFRAELATVGCAVDLHADGSVIGYWDPLRIDQVVVNLLSNAMKYAPGKPIEVISQSDGARAKIVVHDHGEGIPANDRERIFQRFERAGCNERIGGLGLGLYITKQIIEAHGGSIKVESELGAGTAFIAELPLRPTLH